MPMDHTAAPPAGVSYPGFQEPARAEPRPAPVKNRPFPKTAALMTVGTALAVGLAFGYWARPDLGQNLRDAPPMQPVAAAPSTEVVDIEVTPRAPLPAPRAVGKLEVLPPDMVRAAQAAAPVRQAVAAPPLLAVPTAVPAVPGPMVRRAEATCAGARSLAEQIVCEDPGLAAADRRLERAYRRALESGAPRNELREDQRDWLAVREQAARRSSSAVASIYEQRIEELEALADDEPR